jgi:hypothetical protein
MYNYYLLKQIDNEIVVIANKELKPVLSSFKADEHQENMLLAAMNVWLRNHETFKPYGFDERKKFEKWWFNSGVPKGSLREGIEINCCEIRPVDPSNTGSYHFAFYKPEEQKEESQEELFRQAIELFNLEHKAYGRPDYVALLNTFTITRKSK